jgi:serine/threonine-protein kinase HipA
MDEKTLFVYIHLDGRQPVLAGRLLIDETPRSEQARFEYVRSYIDRHDAVAIDPVTLPLPEPGRRVEYTSRPGMPLFGGIRDASPDQWGRDLMVAASGRPLTEYEFLIASGDHRIGDLSFGETPEGPRRRTYWLESTHVDAVLKLTDGVESLVARIEPDAAEEEQLVRLLIDRGSSLGGSRPKASVYDGGRLWIAKFNTRSDAFNMARVEFANMRLAALCGIGVPETRLRTVDGTDLFLIERFDRVRAEGGATAASMRRRGVISGMTLFDHLNLSDARHAGTSYRDICNHLRRLGSQPVADQRQLFRRMVFNIICGNNDDHLKNFSFIRDSAGRYSLSPAYDIVPYPQRSTTRTLILVIGGRGTSATLDNALSWPTAFGFKDAEEARAEIAPMLETARLWRDVYRQHGVGDDDIRRIAENNCFRPDLDA